MHSDAISSYSSQSLGSGAERHNEFTRQMLNAAVTTRSVGVKLGALAVTYSSKDISFAPETAPAPAADFAQELELNRLTHHVSPFRPAGLFAQNATLQKRGVSAYGQQAGFVRNVPPMISVIV